MTALIWIAWLPESRTRSLAASLIFAHLMWWPASPEDYVERAVDSTGPGRIIWRGDNCRAVRPDIEATREPNRQNSATNGGTGSQRADAIPDRQSDGSAGEDKPLLGRK